jgi:formate dehydrogenase iron-sulfur subunit
VLHHADQPALYAGLAPDPHISLLVRLWKGKTKSLSLALIALTALTGFFHFVRVGRNEVDERDEEAARGSLEANRRPELRP